MQQVSFNWLLLVVLLIAVNGENDKKKLVCSQPDGSLEGPRGYCALAEKQGQCECSDDCSQGSTSECVCERSDLVYARDQALANCTVYTQEQWDDYVRSFRNSESYQPLPAASNTLDGKGLLFSTTDQNLAWPITDARDIGGLLGHGSHCFKMVEMFNQQISGAGKLDNSVDKSHYDHCRRLMRRVLAYYTDTESYSVQPKSLCVDLELMSTKARSVDKNKYKDKYGQNLAANEALSADKNKYKDKYDQNLLANEALRAPDADKNKYKDKYGKNLSANKALSAPDADKNKYKDKYDQNLLANEALRAPDADKNKYKDKYGKNLSANKALSAPDADKNKYKDKYDQNLLANEALRAPDADKNKYKDKYGKNLSANKALSAPDADKNKYKDKYDQNLLANEALRAPDADKNKYKDKYGKNLSANKALSAPDADKNKYKDKYDQNLLANEALRAPDADKNKYKDKYGQNLAANEALSAPDADKNKYKDKYGQNLVANEALRAPDADKNKYKDKYGRTLAGADNVNISHEIYESLYNEFQEEGRIVTQQRLFDRISGQNLGDLLVKDWLEQVLTSDEQTFLARWESEQVVRIAAMSIYCDQGDGIAAPFEKLRNLLTNQ